ncbi:MAG: methionyl-tRNA formyltransferase [Nostocoides sp.]
MRLVFAGTPAPAVPSLLALIDSVHEVVAVITRPDAPAGRGRRLQPSPVRAAAEDHGIRVLTPATPKDPQFQSTLRDLAPDACPVVAYGALIPTSALDIPRHGWINLHFSLLPAWRGAAPVQRAVMAGDEVTGASTFRIEAGLDTGPVIGTMTEAVRPDDTSGALLERLAERGAGLLVATMDGLADGSLVPVPQPGDGVSLAPKLEVADARIRWAVPAYAVDRLVRACTPAPGAWTSLRGERVKVLPVTIDSGLGLALSPGELGVSKSAVRVGTGSGVVVLGKVQPHGKQPMAAADWARGVRIEPGERFETDA